jgi:hypothetical protein
MELGIVAFPNASIQILLKRWLLGYLSLAPIRADSKVLRRNEPPNRNSGI